MKKIISLIMISGFLVVLGTFSGCISDTNNNETQDMAAYTFTDYADDYGSVVGEMRTEETNYYNSMHNNEDMSDMMDHMMEYHSTMSEYMDQLNNDLDGMIEYCNSLGMNEEGIWDEMEELHEDCFSEINDHYNTMMNMGGYMMGYWSEMDDHMETMFTYFDRMDEYHEWMMENDAYDHSANQT